MKKALVILNPQAGMRRAAASLHEIIAALQSGGYVSTVLFTTRAGQGTDFVEEYGRGCDLIVCIGGDGTYNEVAAGVIKTDLHIPIGYIPAGSTNDFANSLKLSSQVKTAAQDIVTGEETALDMGSFNGRYFAYVASFGAFTRTSYSTPQNLKNTLGHLAYLLEGIKDFPLQPIHMRVKTEEQTLEGDYLFGAISNSTSIGGLLHLRSDAVDMNDGLLEVLLIQNPKKAIEFSQILLVLQSGNFNNCESIRFFSASRVEIETEADIDWSLDGEKAHGDKCVVIENVPSAIRIMKPKTVSIR